MYESCLLFMSHVSVGSRLNFREIVNRFLFGDIKYEKILSNMKDTVALTLILHIGDMTHRIKYEKILSNTTDTMVLAFDESCPLYVA